MIIRSWPVQSYNTHALTLRQREAYWGKHQRASKKEATNKQKLEGQEFVGCAVKKSFERAISPQTLSVWQIVGFSVTSKKHLKNIKNLQK